MKPLFVLLGAFILSLVATRIASPVDYLLSGRIALAAMLLFTALGHFKFTYGMSLMLPDFIPFRRGMIYFTGIIEIAAAIGIFVDRLRLLTGILLIVFFVLLLPANIYAACKHLNYETGTYDGKGIHYLWFRIPFQFLLIAWTYCFLVQYA